MASVEAPYDCHVWRATLLYQVEVPLSCIFASTRDKGTQAVTADLLPKHATACVNLLALPQVEANINVMEARELSTVLRSCVGMRLRPTNAWLLGVVAALHRKLPGALPIDLAQTAYCLARLRADPGEEYVSELLLRASQVMSGFSPQQLANLAWALGVFEAHPSIKWLNAWCSAVALAAPRMQPIEITQAAKGLVRMADSVRTITVLGRLGHAQLIKRLARDTAHLPGDAFTPLVAALVALERQPRRTSERG